MNPIYIKQHVGNVDKKYLYRDTQDYNLPIEMVISVISSMIFGLGNFLRWDFLNKVAHVTSKK